MFFIVLFYRFSPRPSQTWLRGNDKSIINIIILGSDQESIKLYKIKQKNPNLYKIVIIG